jgi:non-ribosomal peptide synthetase component F
MSAPSKSLQFCRRALDQRSDFWAEQARAIYWQKPFSDVCRFDRPPFVRWFEGGETNLRYNAVDRHLEKRADQFAVHYLSTEVEAEKSYTYRQLHQEVCAFAAVLRSLGLQRGDRVVIYLPMIPEALFSMLACVRVGLVHSVVFAGFAAASLASRIDDADSWAFGRCDQCRRSQTGNQGDRRNSQLASRRRRGRDSRRQRSSQGPSGALFRCLEEC